MTRLVPPHLARAPEDPVTKMEACGFLLYTTPMYCVVTVCDTPVYPSVPLTTPSTVASRSCTGSAVCMIYFAVDMNKVNCFDSVRMDHLHVRLQSSLPRIRAPFRATHARCLVARARHPKPCEERCPGRATTSQARDERLRTSAWWSHTLRHAILTDRQAFLRAHTLQLIQSRRLTIVNDHERARRCSLRRGYNSARHMPDEARLRGAGWPRQHTGAPYRSLQ